MSLEAQRVYLSSRFGQVKTGIPMKIPGQPFKQPTDSAYGTFHIMGGDPINIGIEGEGKKRVRYVHMLQMSIWIPEGGGQKTATVSGDLFKTRFANRQGRDPSGAFYRFDSIQALSVTTSPLGWECSIFRIAYTRDVIEDMEPGETL